MKRKELFGWLILGSIGAFAVGHFILHTFGYNTGMTTLHSLNVGGLLAFLIAAFRLAKMFENSAKISAERERQHDVMWRAFEETNRRQNMLLSKLVDKVYGRGIEDILNVEVTASVKQRE